MTYDRENLVWKPFLEIKRLKTQSLSKNQGPKKKIIYWRPHKWSSLTLRVIYRNKQKIIKSTSVIKLSCGLIAVAGFCRYAQRRTNSSRLYIFLHVTLQLTYQQPAQNGVLMDQLCWAIYCIYWSIMPMQINITIT